MINYIKKYQKFFESKSYNSNKLIIDLTVGMLLINPNFLDNLLDKGLKGRYQHNSSVYINDLKNLLLGNNRLKLGIYKENRFVEDPNIGKINKFFDEIDQTFDIEKDWNKLIKSRNIARNIYDKLLLNEKLNENMIESVLWTVPNKDSSSSTDIVIILKNGKQYPISLHKSLSTKKTKSFNTLSEILFGEKTSALLESEKVEKILDKLAQEWVKTLYTHATDRCKLIIERYIDPDRFYSITWNNFFDIKHRDPQFKMLGEHIKILDKNILTLSDLLNEMYKKEVCFNDYSEMEKTWSDIKNVVFSNRIIEYVITERLKDILKGEIEKDPDGKYIANKLFKSNVLKLLFDVLDIKEELEVNYISSDKYHKLPSKEFFRKNWDNLRILFDYHVNVTEENDYYFNIDIILNDEKLINISLIIDFAGSKELNSRISTKIELSFLDDYNYIIVKSS